MAIEFPCNDCGKKLQTPDDAAGKQARCPSCGEINVVPSTVAEELPSIDQTLDYQPEGEASPSTDEENPFAAPKYSDETSRGFLSSDSGDRDGPAWERDGASAASFIETVKKIWSQPDNTFSTMRRRGGIGGPLMFALIGGTIGGVASAIYGLILVQTIFAQPAGPPGFSDNGFFLGNGAVMTPTRIAFQLILAPISIVFVLFIGAGLNHISLMILGGAKYGYEATFRVLAYTMGATNLLLVIPCIPWITALIAGIANLVCIIIGLSRMQEISGWKAAGAIFLPFLVCFVPLVVVVLRLG